MQGHVFYGYSGDYGYYGDEGDEMDMYRVTADADGNLQIACTFENGGKLGLGKLGFMWNLINEETAVPGETVYINLDCVRAGDQFNLIIRPYSGCTSYELEANITEPNDFFYQRTDLEESIVVGGDIGYGAYFGGVDDRDYYGISSDVAGPVKVYCTFTTQGRVELENAITGATQEVFRENSDVAILEIDCIDVNDFFWLKIKEYEGCSGYELYYEMESSQSVDLNPIPDNEYSGNPVISSNGTVATGSFVEFKAFECVELNEGFQVDLGGDFLGHIADGCPEVNVEAEPNVVPDSEVGEQ